MRIGYFRLPATSLAFIISIPLIYNGSQQKMETHRLCPFAREGGQSIVESLTDRHRIQYMMERPTPAPKPQHQNILGNITNIPKQYWSHNPLPLGQPSHQVYYSGLNNQQISNFAELNDSTRAYCSKHFGYLNKIWRSHVCEIRSSHETYKNNVWKYTNG